MKNNIFIEKYIYSGYGFSKYNNEIYFVENACPGDFVEIEEQYEKKNIHFSKISMIIEPSKHRRKPMCDYFTVCGGCQWLNCDYEEQLNQKTNIVQEQLKRLSSIEVEVDKTIRSNSQYDYRAKMEFAFSTNEEGEIVLGLNQRNSNNIIDIENCPISPKPFDKIKNVVRKLVKEYDVPIYDPKTKKGMLKHLVLRKSFSSNNVMAIFITHTEFFPRLKDIKAQLVKIFNGINVIHVMNSSDKVTLRGPYKSLTGEGVLKEEFDGFNFQIPPTSFFQNNYYVTGKMLKYILEYYKKEKTSNTSLLDLYCGVGLFGNYFAPLFKQVIGIDYTKLSIKAAKANSNINNIKNTTFIAADAKEKILEFAEKGKKFDYVIVDPPRAGLENKLVGILSKMVEKSIIYISCNPSTLARDLKQFQDENFKIKSVQPFDMFPNTYHVETVVILERIEI